MKTLVYHLGIDAGFFTEYTYMTDAIIFCERHGIEFVLYSDDANFACGRGWDDFFKPFCRETHNRINHLFNTHHIPALKQLLFGKGRRIGVTKALTWKAKVKVKYALGRTLGLLAYGRPILLNQDVRPWHGDTDRTTGKTNYEDYLRTFAQVNKRIWHLNEATARECEKLKTELSLPGKYIACQVRGGDKITETELLPPSLYIRLIREKGRGMKDVFVLTDDYAIFEQLRRLAPDMRWYTLCTPEEKGYVNDAFIKTSEERKHRQMTRFLSSMDILMKSELFVGSVTTGPSLFVLKNKWPDAVAADCDAADFPHVATLPINERAKLAQGFLSAISQE